ncbi:uncharacterized protein BKA55DRAFT_684757 [Fusarium redolens]|uniref:Gfd2/YDR514C-like C-terminal domain-containing protein n=1 Tax=Fusarium redolens TaxID=48865 RepID=A0A9P9R6B5_FUSRE|nr:uncharacterized protein BKA55DRAFT_684757 [Fusarium redolens]KAH7267489.1 hypothetical protein BKA55DRAFT_684757 [Fusarium redolens]
MSALDAQLVKLQQLLGNGVKLEERPKDEEDDDETSDNSVGQGDDNGYGGMMERQRQVTREQIAQTVQQQEANTYAARRRELAEKKAKAFDNSKFRICQTVSKDFAFCPFKVVISYPERFVGKVNKPRTKPFFTRILYEKTWDFFYLHDPEEPARDPYLLIPTAQFEVFLEEINLELDTSLKIPPGVNADKFYLKFGEYGTPSPRYLRRSEEETSLDVRPWPAIDNSDTKAFKATTPKQQLAWKAKFRLVKSGFPPRNRADPDKAARKKSHRERMLRNTQRFIGLLGDPDGYDVVFICVDVEALERKPNPVSEIGIAILDTRDTKGIDPKIIGRGWWPFIKTHHLRVHEYAGLRNHQFVKGCPDAFDFGTSTFPTRSTVADSIMKIFNPWLNDQRNIVIVGHDVKQDINYFTELGLDLQLLGGLAEPVDTQDIHQAWRGSTNGRSLGAVLNDLDIAHKHLHNAGNDAHYTLCAMLSIALEDIRKEEELSNKMLNKVD